jgi:hypothetical protein
MSHKSVVAISTLAGLLLAATLPASAPVQADETGAFIGGVFASRIMSNMRRRTEAEEVQAVRSAQPAQAHSSAPAASAAAAPTPEQKLNELDKLAAGGYITPAEYKARRKAILDAM